MKPSVFLQALVRVLEPVLLTLALYLLLRGHQSPGGGFIAGLLVVGQLMLWAVAFDVAQARKRLRWAPKFFVVTGLAVALSSALPSVLRGEAFMKGYWPVSFVGSPVIFDAGVFIVVVGVGASILLGFLED